MNEHSFENEQSFENKHSFVNEHSFENEHFREGWCRSDKKMKDERTTWNAQRN